VTSSAALSPDLLEGRGRRSPFRASALAVASRLVLSLLVLVVALLIALRIDGREPRGPSVDPASPVMVKQVAVTDGQRAPSTTAGLLERLEDAVRTQGAQLIELSLGRSTDAHADVRLRVDIGGSEASRVARVAAALSHIHLDGVEVRSVTPTNDGARLDIGARLRLTTVRMEAEHAGVDVTAVGLAEAVERAGARLGRLEVPEVSRKAGVVLSVDGPVDALVRLLADLERNHTAPTRFESFRVEGVGERHYALTVAFRPRDPVANGRIREMSS